MTTPTPGWLPRVLLLATCAASSTACRHEKLVVYDHAPIPLGEKFELPASRNTWAFHAQPGEKYRLQLEWPDGKLDVKAGSDWRDKGEEEGDDAENISLADVEAAGPHKWTVSWTIGPKANTGFFTFGLAGRGIDPIKVRIDRE